MNANNTIKHWTFNVSGIVDLLQPIDIYSLRGPNYTAGPGDLISSDVDTPITVYGANVKLLEIYKTGNFVIDGDVTISFENDTGENTNYFH